MTKNTMIAMFLFVCVAYFWYIDFNTPKKSELYFVDDSQNLI